MTTAAAQRFPSLESLGALLHLPFGWSFPRSCVWRPGVNMLRALTLREPDDGEHGPRLPLFCKGTTEHHRHLSDVPGPNTAPFTEPYAAAYL